MDEFGVTSLFCPSRSGEDYCRTFDLARRIPRSVVEDSIKKRQLILLNVSSNEPNVDSEPVTTKIIKRLADVIATESSESRPIRICIPLLGSPQWGDLDGKVLRQLF
jgi:elongator complex protein 4